MKKLIHTHIIILAIYLFGNASCVGVVLGIRELFDLFIPMWVLAIICLINISICAGLRISIWLKKDELLTKNEQQQVLVKVFFNFAFVEIMFVIIGIMIIFGE